MRRLSMQTLGPKPLVPGTPGQQTLRLPSALKPGDVIGVVAPASGFPRDTFELGVAWLRAQGFEVRYRDDIFAREHYYAGSLERRCLELQQHLADPEVQAIFCARGGYGSTRLLPLLDWAELDARPRIVLGYSDLTPMLNLIAERLGIIAFHGPLVAGLHKTRQESLQQMLSLLMQPNALPAPISGPCVVSLRGGIAEGALCGGSLTMLAATLGTPFEVETRGKILCLEDVGERPYRLDRLLTQLEMAGKLEGVAGLAFGKMVECEEPGGRGRSLHDIYRQVIERLNVPVVAEMPFGHGPENDTLPLGALARLDGDCGSLQVLHPVVA